jgi:hypothetical protein
MSQLAHMLSWIESGAGQIMDIHEVPECGEPLAYRNEEIPPIL